jgi:hypothetical protein
MGQLKKPTANDKQVGGDHYKKAGATQHWDICDLHGVPYLESAASKYLLRWRDKGGEESVEKAGHYIDKALENLPGRQFWLEDQRRSDVIRDILELCDKHALRPPETRAVVLVMVPRSSGDLVEARSLVEHLLLELRTVDMTDSPGVERPIKPQAHDGRHIHQLSDHELREELAHWGKIIAKTPSWGAAVGVADSFRQQCITEMRRRGLLPGTPEDGGQHAKAEPGPGPEPDGDKSEADGPVRDLHITFCLPDGCSGKMTRVGDIVSMTWGSL